MGTGEFDLLEAKNTSRIKYLEVQLKIRDIKILIANTLDTLKNRHVNRHDASGIDEIGGESATDLVLALIEMGRESRQELLQLLVDEIATRLPDPDRYEVLRALADAASIRATCAFIETISD